MRTSLTSCLCIAAGIAVVVSSPQVASADTVSFTNLPVTPPAAKSATPPAPEKIAAGEHADGIYAAILPEAKRKETEASGYRFITVFSTEHDAQTYASEGTLVNTQHEGTGPRTCLTAGGNLSPRLTLYLRTKPYTPPKPSAAEIARLVQLHRWPPPAPSKPAKAEPQKDTVELIHSERLVQTADAVTLETVDAFIDLQTLGIRAVSKSSTHLVKVAGGPNGLGVFAARDDQGRSQFLVTNPELPQPGSDEDRQAQVQALQSTANRLVAQMPSGSSSETGCGYVRFALTAKPGSGQMATVLATAFLPPADDPDDAGPSESQFESESMSEEQLKMVREMVRRQSRSQRARPVAINVSFSQLESEAAPLLSVTLGWAGADQRLRF